MRSCLQRHTLCRSITPLRITQRSLSTRNPKLLRRLWRARACALGSLSRVPNALLQRSVTPPIARDARAGISRRILRGCRAHFSCLCFVVLGDIFPVATGSREWCQRRPEHSGPPVLACKICYMYMISSLLLHSLATVMLCVAEEPGASPPGTPTATSSVQDWSSRPIASHLTAQVST